MSQASGTATPSQERAYAQRPAGTGIRVDDLIPIALWVDVPRVGVNICQSPFTASGGVQPSNCSVSAYLVTPTGNMTGTVVVGPGTAWKCTFASDPPPNVSLAFVITASDGNGQTRQKIVAFSCGPVPQQD